MSTVMPRMILPGSDAGQPVQENPPGATEDLAGVEIILDLSRLLSRSLHVMPTGVDRVEMAYARTLLALVPDNLVFGAVNPLGFYGRLDRSEAIRFLNETETRWASSGKVGWWTLHARALLGLFRMLPLPVPRARPGIRRFYVQASPNHLHRRGRVESKLRREGARFICLVHDLIPIEFPEYARPNGAALHRRRMETAADLAAGLIANSHATAGSMKNFIAYRTRKPVVRAAHLGTEPPQGEDSPPSAAWQRTAPYFIVISTIEPRKNHILLLNIWRRMVEEYGPAATPHLVIVGRRGWENENVVDMLERCETLRHHVTEYSGLSDAAVLSLLKGARALLCPSFAEGFGMPVSEALAIGTPVICSDLPSLREAGCGIPDHIDPLDGPAWIAAVRNYCEPQSDMRLQQVRRMDQLSLPSWRDHLAVVLDLIRELDGARPEK